MRERLGHADAGARVCEALGRIGGAEAVAALMRFARDDVRSRSACCRSGPWGLLVVRRLWRLWLSLPGTMMVTFAGFAVEGLESVGGAEAVDVLVRLARDDDSDVRCAAARALGSVGGSAALAALVKLAGDDDACVREGALFGLASVSDPEAFAALVKLAGDDEEDVRYSVAWVLGMVTDPDELMQIYDDAKSDRARETLERAMWDAVYGDQ